MWDLKPQHCLAARHLLGWDRARLTRESGVSNQTIGRFERQDGDVSLRNLRKLVEALRRNGIEFEPGEPRGQHTLCLDGTLVRLSPRADPPTSDEGR